MRHYLDLTTDELRMLYAVIPVQQPFENLKPTLEKLERFLEIAKMSAPSELVYRIHRPSEEKK
jgi:arylamine N-acetyltransferase